VTLPLIVPLDGSASAESALPIAAAIARRTGAPLHLIRVEDGVAPGRSVESGMLQRPPDPQRRAMAGAYLGEVAVGLVEASTGGTIVTTQLDGPVVRAVVAYARAEGGMLVMAARGGGDPGRGPVGTVTDRVVRWSGLPVVVVPVTHELHRADRWRCDRMVLVVDGSASLDGILDPAVELARSFGAAVTVASAPGGLALEPVPTPADSIRGYAGDSGADGSADIVGAAVRRLRQAGCPADVHDLRGRLDAHAVLSLAAMLEADIIAVACADRADGGLLRFGSTISGILRRATVPILVHCSRSKVPGRPLGTGERSRGRGSPAPAA